MKITKSECYYYGSHQIETIEITHNNGQVQSSTEISDYLLFAILEKLEEIRCGIIDVEEEVKKLNPTHSLAKFTGHMGE